MATKCFNYSPIRKKQGANQCVDFRTINLVMHCSMIVLKLLSHRLDTKAELYLGKGQYGFRERGGTRDATAVRQVLYERNLEYNNKVFVCYVDYEKAFDWINWVKMVEIL